MRYKEKVEELLININKLCDSANFAALKLAISQSLNLSQFKPNNKVQTDIQERINNRLVKYKDPITDWLNALEEGSIYEINK